MEKKTQKPQLLPVLSAYCILFYGIWTLYVFFGKPFLKGNIENEVLCTFLCDGIIKNLVWTLPAVLLICHFRSRVYADLKTMFTQKVKWLYYLPVFAAFTVYLLSIPLKKHGKLETVSGFGLPLIIADLFVGITEEMVFRGWLLNVMMGKGKKWLPVAVNTLMFLLIHFPTWIMEGQFLSNLLMSWSLMLLSVLFSVSFICSKNILVPVLLHTYWDLLCFMFLE